MNTGQLEREWLAWQQIRTWRHPVGTPVIVRKDDGTEVETKTASKPEVRAGLAVIWLEGLRGCYLLSRVRVKP